MRSKVFVLSLSLIFVLCSSFSVFASSSIVNFRYTEPTTSPTQGYLVVRTTSDNNYCFFWSINPKTGDGASDAPCTSSMNLIINSDSIVFTPLTTGGVSASYHITSCSSSGNLNVRASGNFEGSASYTWSAKVSEVCYYGNIGIVDNNLGSSDKWLRVNWGDVNTLNEVSSTLSSILSKIDYGNDVLDSIESSANDIESDVDALRKDIDNISSDVELIYGQVGEMLLKLGRIESYVEVLLDEVYSISVDVSHIRLGVDSIMDMLGDLLGLSGEEPTDSLDDSALGSLDDFESDIINDNSSALDDLSFEFGNGFDAVWDMVSRAWQSNPKVFTVVIMCLTIGLLKLIFNR